MKPKRLVVLLLTAGIGFLAARIILTGPKPTPHSFHEDTPLLWRPVPNLANIGRRQPQAADRKPKNKDKADQGPPVVHNPQSPKTGQAVLITADLTKRHEELPSGDLILEYQLVDPGKYIALEDEAYQKRWTRIPMNDRGAAGDVAPNDGIFSAELPANLQKHRRLVRYRIRPGDGSKVLAPGEGDTQPNFAYFVYDGVPPWKGAIDPKSRDARLRQMVTYSSEALQRVPVYHFISSKAAVEEVTWRDRGDFGGQGRNEYRHTGTMVYDGIVYDHVGFRARGGGWRHAMGKNMWKFNFLPGHRFEPRDHYGNRYNAKWDKLNLGACIQQGDYGMRGEQGMFESVGFRMFNLAGTEAPRTHWVHLRIIDGAEESPADQYDGDFWGLYLAVENIDEHFLKEHGLPKGNVYKMEFGAKTAFNGDPTISDQSDIESFARASGRRQLPDSWWAENVDLSRYYRYRAILECIHHYDIDSGKNYFYYHNPQTEKWVVLPWDIDLSWGDHMFGGGYEPFYRAGVLSRPAFRQAYQEQVAEIRDLLYNPEHIGRLIDEHAAMISDPKGAPSLVDADRAKWDYNPILESSFVMESKAGRGRFYFGNPRNNFQAMVKYMKSYAAKRAKWMDARLLAGYRPPDAPQIAGPISSTQALTFKLAAAPENAGARCQWRLAEVTDPASPAFDPRQPWKHEIQALWQREVTGPQSIEIPPTPLVQGHTYRVRARWKDDKEGWSRWSSPIEFTWRGHLP